MYLVFDVGGTFIKYAWMTPDGEILDKGKIPTKLGADATAEEFIDSIVEIYNTYKEKGEVQGIAMDLPGQIDVEKGIVYGGGALAYLDKVHLGEILSKRCDNIRVSMENDAKAAALAEVWKGNAKDAKDACMLVIGTGVGGAVIIDRKVHRGSRLLAGELSYFIGNLRKDDIDMVIPVETTSHVTEVFEKMPFLSASNCTTAGLIYNVAKKKGMAYEDVSGELVYKMLDEGDKEVEAILEEMYFSIAKLCVSLYLTIDPDVILIGGGISAEPRFLEGIQRYVDKLKCVVQFLSGIKLDTCKFRNDSNLIGALYNFKQLYDEI